MSELNALVGVHCTLGCVYVLLTLLFWDCAFQADVRCKCLTNTILHYITSWMTLG